MPAVWLKVALAGRRSADVAIAAEHVASDGSAVPGARVEKCRAPCGGLSRTAGRLADAPPGLIVSASAPTGRTETPQRASATAQRNVRTVCTTSPRRVDERKWPPDDEEDATPY